MKDSIEIKIEPFQEIDILNLYLIIKSYSCNLIYIPSNLFIIIKNKEEKEFIALNSNIYKFKNFSYYGFYEWFYKQLYNDWEYIKNDGSYHFVITYPIKIFDIENLPILKPRYPWNIEIIEKIIKLEYNEKTYLDIIKKQKEEIENLKKKIEDITKKNN